MLGNIHDGVCPSGKTFVAASAFSYTRPSVIPFGMGIGIP